ncbi:unnamed protein product [Ambrosiozyma monospora]|uniref:Unnamed protein product n=1 Tax=Ambrosiozyma monospora TaxID=43982 RepID=A0ACB5TBB6_AMBMO|nr:unnamed protein product [Ambrosiozyma monospora]
MGISRDSRHKRAATGAKRAQFRKKRKFELGRQGANTKIGTKRIHAVRTRGGNSKYRAIRIETGNFSWASEGVSRKTRISGVVYHPSNNELVRTNTLTKAAIVQIDATPFKSYYESHYGVLLGKKGKAVADDETKRSGSLTRKLASRAADAKIEQAVSAQFGSGKLYAAISSRPGQSGRCDGYILEGEELAFYLRRLTAKK